MGNILARLTRFLVDDVREALDGHRESAADSTFPIKTWSSRACELADNIN